MCKKNVNNCVKLCNWRDKLWLKRVGTIARLGLGERQRARVPGGVKEKCENKLWCLFRKRRQLCKR